MFRSILAVIFGYLVFALSAAALFSISKVDPHSDASTGFMIFTGAYGMVFAAIGGVVATIVAKRNRITIAVVLGTVIGIGALISLLSRPGKGAIWTQVTALLLMAPSAIIGGWLNARRYRN